MDENGPTIRTNFGLRFYHEILGLDNLHHGVWEEQEQLTYQNLLRAQERYVEHNLSLIPDGVVRILDVGCGVGTTAMALTAQGYEVTGMTPEPYQREHFVARTGRPCILSHFGPNPVDATYDLVLMSESCQYIDRRYLFDAIRQAAPGGLCLVSDYFSIVDDGTRFTRTCHDLQWFVDGLEKNGFVILHEDDITESTVPTLDLIRQFVDARMIPALQLSRELAASKHPLILKLVLWFLRKEINRFSGRLSDFDSGKFRAKRKYMRYLIRVPA